MKILLLLLAVIWVSHLECEAQAAGKPIMLVAPVSAGGGNDIVARSLVPALEKELGMKVIVKNIPGAGGTIGAAEVSKADPDGYTLGCLSTGQVALQPQIRELPYTTTSFKPVAGVYNTPFVLMVRSNSTFSSVADLKNFFLEKNGDAAFGSPGPGGLTHIASVAFVNAMGAKGKHIPDRSSPEAIKNLAGGVTQFYIDQLNFLASYDVKALGIFTDQRHPDFPDIPTMKEQGYDFEFSMWGGIFTPSGTPDTVVDKLERAVRTASNSPEFKLLAQKSGFTIRDMSSKDFSAFIDKQLVVSKALIDKFGLRE